jgi:3-phosphoshikimate 1-carboxyvinyltransferase
MQRMTDPLPIPPARTPVVGRVRPPGSKSITNRALVCAALARGPSDLTGVLDSEDTRVMAAGLAALGVSVDADWAGGRVVVAGTAGTIPADAARIDCAASGTTMRFLSAVCALGHGTYRLDGTPRMRQRPIGDLLAPLRELGVDATAESPGDCPPVVIHSAGLRGGGAHVRGGVSSQFASGLALVAPCTARGLQFEFPAGRVVSVPYLEMTRQVMGAFGATCGPLPSSVAAGHGGRWDVPTGGYAGTRYAIEPDASAASYFFAAAAITGGRVTVEGIGRGSLQGDVAFCDALARMGCDVTWEDGTAGGPPSISVAGRAGRGIDVDMNAISDTVPTLAVVALFATGTTVIRNVAHIRDKETDRIGDLVRELRRLGGAARETADGLVIEPASLHGASVATYDDHRMAMSLALAGLVVPDVRIENPRCVGKTFPTYWDVMGRLAGWPAHASGV